MQFIRTMRLSMWLAIKVLTRSSKTTLVLTIFIMTLTFLALVSVYGILVGLIDGGNNANRQQYTSDVIITKRSGENSITETTTIIDYLRQSPYVNNYSVRYGTGVVIEAGYTRRSDFSVDGDTIGTQLIGLDVAREDSLTHLSNYVVEGEFLHPTETGYILLGADMIKKYNSAFGDQFDSLDAVAPGEKVRVTANGKTLELIVKGIVDTKVGEVSFRSFVPIAQFNQFVETGFQEANEIAVEVKQPEYASLLKQSLEKQGFDRSAKIQLASEAIPDFLNQIRLAFGLLGGVIGFIMMFVAAVTIFIIVYMNAVSRQKYIGILKGIGITPGVIIWSYIFQSLCYAIVGATIATGIIYGLLVPYFNANPLDFPFSDGILSAPYSGTLTRFLFLLVVSFLAGLIPAWRIVRRNTLNSILGR